VGISGRRALLSHSFGAYVSIMGTSQHPSHMQEMALHPLAQRRRASTLAASDAVLLWGGEIRQRDDLEAILSCNVPLSLYLLTLSCPLRSLSRPVSQLPMHQVGLYVLDTLPW